MRRTKGGVITIADSLSLPRPWDENSPSSLEQTWPFLLAEGRAEESGSAFDWHWPLSISGGRAADFKRALRHYGDHLTKSRVSLVVAQFGVVDATPRHLPQKLSGILERTDRILGTNWNRGLRRRSAMYRVYGRPWTSRKQFRDNLTSIVCELRSLQCPILFVPIFQPKSNLLEITRMSLVDDYNKIFLEFSSESSLVDIPVEPELVSDGYHLSTCGHQTLARAISKKVAEIS